MRMNSYFYRIFKILFPFKDQTIREIDRKYGLADKILISLKPPEDFGFGHHRF